MIAKESQEEPVDAGSLGRLSVRELLELLVSRVLEAEEILLELKVRDMQLENITAELAKHPKDPRLERDPDVRTEDELGLTEPYPDIGSKTGL